MEDLINYAELFNLYLSVVSYYIVAVASVAFGFMACSLYHRIKDEKLEKRTLKILQLKQDFEARHKGVE